MMPVRPSICVSDPVSQPGAQRRDGEGDGEQDDGDDPCDGMYDPTEPGDDKPRLEDVNEDMLFRDEKAGVGERESDPITEGKTSDPIVCVPCGNRRIPNKLSSPMKPSAVDVDEHYCTHLPYRNWCPVCVKAKAKEGDHKRGVEIEDDKSGLPIVALDYQALNEETNEEGEKKKMLVDKSEDDGKLKMIVGKDEPTGNVLAHFVLCKGIGDEWAVKRIVKDLEEMGRGHAIVKTDGEPAIVAVQNRLQALRAGRTVPRNPPAYNPESNGPCEKAVQDVAAHLRAVIIGLESRLSTSIDDRLPIVQWALEHAVFLINKFSVGHDGMTPYERCTGRKWRRPIVEFGEIVLAKMALRRAQRGKKKKERRKLAPRSVEGVWVGQVARTGEHIIIKPSGDAVKCRTVRRVPVEHRWNPERVLLVRATPRLPTPSSKNPEVLESRLADDEAMDKNEQGKTKPGIGVEKPESGASLGVPEARHREPDVREFRINERILNKYGYTDGCQGCNHKRHGLPGHLAHDPECRERLRNLMDADEVDKRVLEAARKRLEATQPGGGEAPGGRPSPPKAPQRRRPEPADQQPSTPKLEQDDEPNERSVEVDDTEMADSEHPANEPDDDMPELEVEADSDMEIEDEGMNRLYDDDDPLAEHKRKFDEEEDDEDDEPSSPRKKQRLVPLFPRIVPTTMAGQTMCGKNVELQNALNICAVEMAEAKQHVNIKEIIEQLEKDSRLKLPLNRRRRRTMQQQGKFDVAEVYSPPRIAKTARRMGLRAGWALDLTEVDPEDNQPWDFSKEEKRKKAKKLVDQDKPTMLIVCPMCGPFSKLQEVFNYPKLPKEDVEARLREALEHLGFAIDLCCQQHEQGRFFLFEHPASAASWYSQAVVALNAIQGVYKVNFDFCMLGMEVQTKDGEAKAAKKRTSVLTNSHAVASLLQGAQCRGEHKHEQLLNGLAGPCQEYPEKFCRLVCEGVRRELDCIEWRARLHKTFDITTSFGQLMSIQAKVDLATPPEEDPFQALYEEAEFVDDNSGMPLDKELAIQARKLEVEYFRKMGVYTKVVREWWMKPISTRWLDTNKGDEAVPNYRARLVGREIKKDKRNDLFAATPPVESMRMLVSVCASRQGDHRHEKNFIVMTNDVKRAYFYAPVTRPIYVIIPPEDREPGDEDKVGQLNLSLYGTRDAAMNWTKTYTDFMVNLGFRKGRASPCNFFHPEREISTTVHGDDFTSTGTENQLRWLDTQLKSRFEIKTDYLGPGDNHAKQLRILNRILSWEHDGIAYEADQRHAEIIIKSMNVQKSVSTPGSRDDAAAAGPPNTTTTISTPTTRHQPQRDQTVVSGGPLASLPPTCTSTGWTGRPGYSRTTGADDHDGDVQSMMRTNSKASEGVEGEEHGDAGEALGSADATVFRALAARANYLAQDRPDIQYAVKEIARRMSRPTGRDWILLKRLARYLLGAPRGVLKYYWQDMPSRFDVFVDSDWAGCKATARSTNGGAARFGWHTIKTWSSTQTIVALSSGEAELYSLTKGAAQTLGLLSLAADFGISAEGQLHTDATATLGIVQREGLGKLRHVNVQYLWIQDRIRGGELSACKVPGTENPADMMTKHLPAADILRHAEDLALALHDTRAEIAPSLDSNDMDEWEFVDHNADRIHNRPRRTLFTPLRVEGTPTVKTFTSARITEGVYCKTGEKFKVVDNWTCRSGAHAPMKEAWVGRTRFLRKSSE